jgi:hypothetical protein
MRKRRISVLLFVMLVAMIALAASVASAQELPPPGPPSGDGIQPTVLDGNPACKDLDPSLTEFKIEPVSSGTYTSGPITVNLAVNNANPAGPTFDWTSNIGIDKVIVKGGNDANAYVYDPPSESKGDTNLHAPVNDNGKYFGLSHISFCYDLNLDVSKTANTSLTRTFEWTIDKSVTPKTADA